MVRGQPQIFNMATAFLLIMVMVIVEVQSGYEGATNQAGINLIQSFEGFVPRPSPDPVGLPTICYGHLCRSKSCAEVSFRFPATRAQCETLLKSDLKTFENCLQSHVHQNIKLNQNQVSALVSWAYNVGCGNVKSSSLISRLNAGENPNTVIAQELPQWNKGGGKVLPGLVRRRAAELKLAQIPSNVVY